MSTVVAEKVPWLWAPLIPLEMITVLSGDPGTGKTTLALAIAAALSRGEVPFSSATCQPGNTLILTVENSLEFFLKPQFDMLRGNSERLYQLDRSEDANKQASSIALADLDQLSLALDESKARLVICDPLSSFIRIDQNRADLTRPILDGLVRLAKQYHCAILLLRHNRKSAGGSALQGGVGSIDISGAARSELAYYTDRDDRTRRILAPLKNNLGEWPDTFTFTKGENGDLLCVNRDSRSADDLCWIDEKPKTVTESKLEATTRFLNQYLGSGRKPTKEVEAAAVAAGFSVATLKRARQDLHVEAVHSGFAEPYYWKLPETSDGEASRAIPLVDQEEV